MNEMLVAENRQLRAKLQQAGMEIEKFARIAVVLVHAIIKADDSEILRVGDSLAIKKDAFESVPKKWRISAQAAEMKPVADVTLPDEALPSQYVMALIVSPVKEKPTLVVAQEAPSAVVTP